jgi:amino acid transporter
MSAAESRLDSRGLQRNELGEIPVLFQAITAAGPAVGVAASLVFAASYAGGATPLTAILTTIAILFIAVGMGQMARHLPSAGGLYTFTAAGFGRPVGFIVSWALSFAYLLDAPLIFLLFAYITQANLSSHLSAPTWVWAPITVAGIALVCVLVFRGIKLSTRVGVILGIIEIVIFLARSVTLIAKAGGHNTLSVFSPSAAPHGGIGPVFAGMIFGVLAFVGFDAAAPIAEEAKTPRRVVPRALVWSVVVTGALFTFCFYAAAVYWGPAHIVGGDHSFVLFNGGDPFDGVAKDVWGTGWILVLLAVINSAFASVLGVTNGAVRIGFALGRIGVFPKKTASIHQRFGTPWIMVAVVAAISAVLGLLLGWRMGGPSAGFAFLGALVTLLFVPVYALAALSCTFYYWRHRRDEFNLLLHGVFPVLGALFLVPVLVASFGINFFGLGIPALSGNARFAPLIAGSWLALGIAAFFYFRKYRPGTLEQLDRIFIDEPAADDVSVTAPSVVLGTSPGVLPSAALSEEG